MYIFLDESKQIIWDNWEFIFWWLVTTYKPSTIDKIYYEFLKENWIKEKWWEIKSFDSNYRDDINSFYEYLVEKNHMKNIEFIWLYATWYKESWKNYYKSLVHSIKHTIINNEIVKDNFLKVTIIADNLKLDYKEEKIQELLNNDEVFSEFKNIKKFNFTFSNSKRYWWLKFSDFIAWILRKKYILQKEELPYNFIEYFVNDEITFLRLK